MKYALKSDTKVTINGVTVGLEKGASIDLPCFSVQEALELSTLTKLPIDLSYVEDGVQYIAGANGKFIPVPKVEKLKSKAKAAPKAQAPKKATSKPRKA